MTCYHPIPAHQNYSGGPVTICWKLGFDADVKLPCGKCIGCRTDRATRWAHRCVHEASLWQHNTFITLTYDDAHLPKEGHLEPRELQLFIKRLRRCIDRGRDPTNSDRDSNLRFLAAGEYGDQFDRPHYHAILFNIGFADREPVGTDLYCSPLLGRLWPQGHNRLGSVTAASAAYVAQYGLKTGTDHDADGVWRPPHFLRCSRRPAIGLDWLRRYKEDLQHGYLIDGTRKHGIPRYYRKRLVTDDPQLSERIQLAQQAARASLTHYATAGEDQSEERLLARELIHKRRKQLSKQRS